VTALEVQPVRRRIDPAVPAGPPLTWRRFVNFDNVAQPILVLRTTPGLVRLAASGTTLAVSQGVWIAFLVTILVERFGMTLVAAGSIFAVMQMAGIVGRIGLGWIADRIRSGTATLRAAAILSAACTLVLALLPAGAPTGLVVLLCGVAGATVTGWNGVQISEVARLSPPGRVRETAAGATLLLFVGYVLGPVLFALAVEPTGGYMVPLLAVAALTAASALVPRGDAGPVRAA
jgi:predicted MFS family arabinose efflux permease